MNNVQFQDQQGVRTVQKKGGLTGLFIKMGLAKDEKSAQMVMLIVAVVAVAIALFFMFGGGGVGEPTPAEQAELEASLL